MQELSIQQALIRAFSLLKSKSPTPHLDARVLLCHLLSKDEAYLYTYPCNQLPIEKLEKYLDWVNRRGEGEPVAYIVGEKEFMGLSFKVNPAVLIPRPETEILVESAIKTLKDTFPGEENFNILDIGTGSGAIAISLAYLLPKARVTAIDISPKALEIARKNASLLGVTKSIKFLLGDLFSPLERTVPKFHLIASNPPYISKREIALLDRNVKDYEPLTALEGGSDGLEFYRRLIPEALNYLKEKGIVALEIGENQAPAVTNLFPNQGDGSCGCPVKIIKDYAGKNRVVLGTWYR